MDLIRLLAGDPHWCFARVLQGGKPISAQDVREGDEGVGRIAGDEIHAMYGIKSPGIATFDSHRARNGAGERWGVRIFGSKGLVTVAKGAMPTFPDVYLIEDPAWSPGSSKAQWIPITSAGLGKPETEKDISPQAPGNLRLARDLIHAIQTDTQPRSSMYDARAALEMILAVYESQRTDRPVTLPLKERRHPLDLLSAE
jgi:predicted dehydrogenase